jgi:oxysterol-binding protein-related protein 8
VEDSQNQSLVGDAQLRFATEIGSSLCNYMVYLAILGRLTVILRLSIQGQDMTKISLPAELCHPYTMLEVMSYRETTLFKLLFGINEVADPTERFLRVLKWHLSMVRQENFEKKPFNPVLGETHISFVDDDGKNGSVEFISEQVCHHPPVSAFSVKNDKHNLDAWANISFSVKFGGNSATIATSGGASLKVGQFEDELYEMSRCIPNMLVRNVVWGTKYIIWEGDLTMTCKKTGLEANLVFSEARRQENRVEGTIKNATTGEILFNLAGVCGSEIFVESPKGGDKRLLLDVSKEEFDEPKYLPVRFPLDALYFLYLNLRLCQESALTPMSSVAIWGPVNEAILKGDIAAADVAKQQIEAAQRVKRADRAAKGEEYEGQFFCQGENDIWRLKSEVSISKMVATAAAGPEVGEAGAPNTPPTD